MQLGQLAAERNTSSATAGAGKVAKRLKDAPARLIDHRCTLIRSNRADHTTTISPAARKESLEAPTRTSNARGDKGGKDGGCSRDRNYPNARGDSGTNKLLTRIAN